MYQNIITYKSLEFIFVMKKESAPSENKNVYHT